MRCVPGYEMIWEKFLPYQDFIGLIQDRKQFWLSGNGIAYSAEAGLTLEQNGESPLNALRGIPACEITPGLYERHTDPRGFSNEQESIDDYLALALASARSSHLPARPWGGPASCTRGAWAS